MKVLLIVNGLPDEQNPARSVYNIRFAEELTRHGLDLTILHIRSFSFKRYFIKRKSYRGLNVVEIPAYIPLLTGLWYFPVLVRKFTRQELDFDLIHVIDGGEVLTGHILSLAFKIPYICQFIGSDVNFHLPKRRTNISYLRALESCSMFTFNSQALKECFFRLVNLRKDSSVIYRGIDLRTYPMRETPLDPTKISFLFLGGFVGENGNLKGGVTLLRALKSLDRIENSGHAFKIAGPNSDRYKKFFEFSHIDVQFLGAIHRNDVQRYMDECNVVIIPSLNEGLPNVLYEAMASSKFVIATRVGGIPEVLRDDCGVLIQPDNIDELKSEIEKTLNSAYDLSDMSKCSYRRVQDFQYRDFIDKYINIYRNCIIK